MTHLTPRALQPDVIAKPRYGVKCRTHAYDCAYVTLADAIALAQGLADAWQSPAAVFYLPDDREVCTVRPHA